MLGWEFIKGDNPDFSELDSPLLNIEIFASIMAVFGVLVAPLFDRMARILPPLSLRRPFGLPLPAAFSLPSLAAHAVYYFGIAPIVVTELTVAIAGLGDGGAQQWYMRVLGSYILVVPAGAVMLLTRTAGGFQRLSDLRANSVAMAVAVAVIAQPVVIGGMLVTRKIAHLFAAA